MDLTAFLSQTVLMMSQTQNTKKLLPIVLEILTNTRVCVCTCLCVGGCACVRVCV